MSPETAIQRLTRMGYTATWNYDPWMAKIFPIRVEGPGGACGITPEFVLDVSEERLLDVLRERIGAPR